MIYERSTLAVAIFAVFVGITLGLSFYLGRRAKSASGYFAAGGGIHWFVNGIAFAGDYLSAASFLGICGMIAFYGYDGFLYSVGYLAGWIVALFVVAEPLKRMGKFTFADALDSRFQSRGIKISAAISTLAVSIFYLIPQMVGAGALIKPLLGFSHATGVITVGAVVILIVTTAGMVSTTYVQFIKGSLLVIFSTVLVVMILNRGIDRQVSPNHLSVRVPLRELDSLEDGSNAPRSFTSYHNKSLGVMEFSVVPKSGGWIGKKLLRLKDTQSGKVYTCYSEVDRKGIAREELDEATTPLVQFTAGQTVTTLPNGKQLIDGIPRGRGEGEADLWPVGHASGPYGVGPTGPLGHWHSSRNFKNRPSQLGPKK